MFPTEWIPGLAALPGWAIILIAAALLFVETALFVGLVLPAEMTLLLVGLLAYQGVIDLAVCLPVFIVAGALGDQAAYWSGRLIDSRTHQARAKGGRFATHSRRAERMLVRWGGPAVLIGRWIPFVRTFMPVAAGVTRLNSVVFLVFACGGVVTWMTTTVLIGYSAGGSLELAGRWAGQGTIAVVGVAVVVTLVLRGVRHRKASPPPDDSAADQHDQVCSPSSR
jgi:membrane protein DedA with SNARE-associated domain